MIFTRFDANVENVSALSDLPNDTDGLTPSGLKAVFDKAGVDIKEFINEVLIPQIEYAIPQAGRITLPAFTQSYSVTFESGYSFDESSTGSFRPAPGYESDWENCGIRCYITAENTVTVYVTLYLSHVTTRDVPIDFIIFNHINT